MVLRNDTNLDSLSFKQTSGSLVYILKLFCRRIPILFNVEVQESLLYSQRAADVHVVYGIHCLTAAIY